MFRKGVINFKRPKNFKAIRMGHILQYSLRLCFASGASDVPVSASAYVFEGENFRECTMLRHFEGNTFTDG